MLNTPEDRRQKALDEDLKQFAYINGDLFAERLPIPAFDSVMRATPARSLRLFMGRDLACDFRRAVPIGDERARAAARRARTTRPKKTSSKSSSRCSSTDLRAEFARSRDARHGARGSAARLSGQAGGPALLRSRLRLRQLPHHRLSRAARARNRGLKELSPKGQRALDVTTLSQGGCEPVLRHRDWGVSGAASPKWRCG